MVHLVKMLHLAFNIVTILTFLVYDNLANDCIAGEESMPNLTISDNNKFLAKSDDFVDVEVDGTLRFKCEGSEAIVWHSSDFDLYSKKSQEFVTFNESSIDGKFISQLTIEEITVDEIGYYSCHYNRSFNADNYVIKHNKFNSIYVFVTDPVRLFAGFHSQIPAINNSQINGVCRPTSSFTKISLWEINENNSIFNKFTLVSIGPQTGIEFDQKSGFRIKKLTKERFRCLAKIDETAEEERIVWFHFQIGVEKYDPFIDDFNKTFIFIGDNFTIDCRIRKPVSSDFTLDWTIDGHCDQNRPIIGDPAESPTVNQSFHILSKNISIVNAKLSDQGLYKCSVHDWGNNIKQVSKLVEIYETPKLELLTNNNGREIIEINKEFVFNVTINSVPNDIRALQINWTKNGLLLQSHITERIIISRVSSELTYLLINGTECEDSGLYRVEANLLDKILANVSVNLTLSGCGYDFNSKDLMQQNEDKSDLIITIVIFVIFGSVLLIIAVAIGQKIREARRQKRDFELLNYNLFEQGQAELINPDLPLDEQIDLLPYHNKWEFPKEHLLFGQILGQGAFGRVIKAEAFGILTYKSGTSFKLETTTVAVKTLKERADLSQRKALLAELKILIHVGRHINIVNLLGAVTKDLIRGELMVIVEYCENGNIRSHLLSHRNSFVNLLEQTSEWNDSEVEHRMKKCEPKYANINESFGNEYQNVVSMTEINEIRAKPITTCDLISYVFQCAHGMEYLSSKKLIHRDLAARNVLVTEDDIVKICDFGLARDCYNYDNYVKKGEGPLPIKWMAIESMRDKVYTEKSDVWSFGVLMWEVFTLGSNPYPGFDLDEEFYKKLVEGYRMERPKFAPNSIYSLMRDCWQHEPNDRPNFTALTARLRQLMSKNNLKKYEESVSIYSQMNEQNKEIDDYMKMNENQTNANDSYVDMTANSSSGHRDTPDRPVGHSVPDIARPVHSDYDKLTNVRSIYVNTPMPKEPMEVVPMIQL